MTPCGSSRVTDGAAPWWRGAGHSRIGPGDVVQGQRQIEDLAGPGMFRLPVTTAQLRDLIRYRKALINENTAPVTRIHKVLQDSGIKPATCAADVISVSGRAMMRALIGGQSDSAALAELAKARVRTKIPDLRQP